jgi:hypothetical protein
MTIKIIVENEPDPEKEKTSFESLTKEFNSIAKEMNSKYRIKNNSLMELRFFGIFQNYENPIFFVADLKENRCYFQLEEQVNLEVLREIKPIIEKMSGEIVVKISEGDKE